MRWLPRGEEVTMLVARPTALAVFDALEEIPSASMLAGCADYGLPTPRSPISVRPDDIAMSAEPAASTG